MSRALAATGAALAASALLAAPGAGQRWQVDVGGSVVRADTAPGIASVLLAPLLELGGRGLYAAIGGGFASFEQSQWTAQGQGNISVLLEPGHRGGPVRIELAGAAAGSRHSSGYRTAITRAEARVYLMGRGAGGWVGGAAQTGWASSGEGIAHAVGPTAGAWTQGRRWHLTALATPYRLEGFWFPELQARGLAWIGPADVTAYAGWRGAPAGTDVPATTWGGATVALWLGDHAAVVVGAGSYPGDLLQALPGGRYVSAALRIASRRPRVPAPPEGGRAVYARAPGDTELRFRVAGATRVELIGDWTAWQPVSLRRAADGAWVTRVTLDRGAYRFNLIVDGNRWTVPDGVVAVDDGFGGRMALLVVP